MDITFILALMFLALLTGVLIASPLRRRKRRSQRSEKAKNQSSSGDEK